jgi:hypothetical protein
MTVVKTILTLIKQQNSDKDKVSSWCNGAIVSSSLDKITLIEFKLCWNNSKIDKIRTSHVYLGFRSY